MGARNDVAAGAAASDTQQANGLSKAKKALTKLRAPSEATLKLLAKARWRVGLSFFVVGMSMATFIASAIQCLDYLESQYPALNIKKVIDTSYSFGFFVVAAQFFFKGKPDTSHKPRQRARLIVGILIQLFALVMPIVVDTIYQHKLLPRVYQKWGLDPKEEIKLVDLDKKQRLIMTRDQSLMAIPWAIGAMLAGGSDGLLSVVIFAEAKAVKGDKAAQYGRVFVMLFMPALRCVSKAIITTNLPLLSRFQDELTRLRISAAAHVVIAAIILIACLLLVTYVVPKEVAVMNQVEPLNVPPALNMAATMQTAIEAEDDSPEGDEAKASMQAGGSLAAMNPAADAAFVTPLIEIKGFSFRWLNRPVPTDPDAPDAAAEADSAEKPGALQERQSIMTAEARQPTMRRFLDSHRSSTMRRQAAAGDAPLTPTSSVNPTLTPAGSIAAPKDVEGAPDARTETAVARARMRRLGSLSATTSGSYRQRRGASGDVQVILEQQGAKGAPPTVLYDVDEEQDQKALGGREKQLSGVSEGDERDEDGGQAGYALPPAQTQEKEKPKDAGSSAMPLGTKLKCCWEAALGVWPFLMICFIMPMVNSQLMQLAQQPEYSDRVYGRVWRSTFYIQIVEFAKVLGGFGGSLFFHQVKRTWVMVLMAGVMLLFLPAFGLSYFCAGGPAVKIGLAWIMCTYSGYLNSVAKGTSSKRRPAEERWIQMVLSLVSAAAFFCGNVIGWAWTAAPERDAPWQNPDEWAQRRACYMWYSRPRAL